MFKKSAATVITALTVLSGGAFTAQGASAATTARTTIPFTLGSCLTANLSGSLSSLGCANWDNQNFSLSPAGSNYTIRDLYERCITTTIGGGLWLAPCAGTAGQTWAVRSSASGKMAFQDASFGRVLTANPDTTVTAAPVYLLPQRAAATPSGGGLLGKVNDWFTVVTIIREVWMGLPDGPWIDGGQASESLHQAWAAGLLAQQQATAAGWLPNPNDPYHPVVPATLTSGGTSSVIYTGPLPQAGSDPNNPTQTNTMTNPGGNPESPGGGMGGYVYTGP